MFCQYVQDYLSTTITVTVPHLGSSLPSAELDICSQSYEEPRTGSCELLARSKARFLAKKFALLLFMCTLWQNADIYTKATSHLSCVIQK